MNITQAKRLLNVAKATRESSSPEDFDMRHYAHPCGTPGCVLGQYAARPDLQRLLALRHGSSGADEYTLLVYRSSSEPDFAWFDDEKVRQHFGITEPEAYELFSAAGCSRAKTPKAAARYIERFVKHKLKQRIAARRRK